MPKEVGFFEKVHDAARQIPYGRVSTYGAIAAFIGAPKAAKMVGWAMNSAHIVFPPVPAHRVVNRNGLLTGKNHFEYPEKMAELLEDEGVSVLYDKVVDFKTLFFDFE